MIFPSSIETLFKDFFNKLYINIFKGSEFPSYKCNNPSNPSSKLYNITASRAS